MTITFRKYVREFKSIWGIIATALGLSGTIFKFFSSINPPLQNIEFSSALMMIFAIILPYLIYSITRASKRTCFAIASTLFAPGVALVVFYFGIVSPHWVYAKETSTGVVRAVKGDSSCYSTKAKEFIARERKANEIEPSDRMVVEHFNVENIDVAFTELCLRHAERALFFSYSAMILAFQLAFCFFVLGEALPSAKKKNA
jgi:hypothetical protein